MPVTRRFLIAPSLTRFIRKECASERVTEGHFPPQSERQAHVRIERGRSHLILTSLEVDVGAVEDRSDLPTLHAEALLDVCPGAITFERSVVRLDRRRLLVERFIAPGPLDRISVEFTTDAEAAAFSPPVWFGSEVTEDEGYANRAIALSGLPQIPETPLSNSALEAVLDVLEGPSGDGLFEPAEREAEAASHDTTFDMLRRLAVVPHASSSPKAPDVSPGEADRATAALTDFKPRRPVLEAVPDHDEKADDRLAGVIEGLSEALTQPSEKEGRSGVDVSVQPGWRWSAH